MRTLTGTIVSNRMTKTVVVRVDRLRQHAKYRKFYKVSRKYKASADDSSAYSVGDFVAIAETRPMSKDKRWKVVKVVKPASREVETEQEASDKVG